MATAVNEPKTPVRYQDPFQQNVNKKLEEAGKIFEGKGRTIMYGIASLAVIIPLIFIVSTWSRRSNGAAHAALGKAIETSQARVSDQPAPAGSTDKVFKTEKERAAKTSHDRALAAIREGRFDREVVPYPLPGGDFRMDETARESTLEKMATLAPVDPAYPKITAAVSSSTCDAASAVLVASAAAVKRYGLKQRARIVHLSVRADDPIWHLTAPIPATAHALKKSGMKLADIDLVEINEAFASG